jgi:cation diffusion facilitator CzcD-associated flavoprotein CzcO
MARWDADVVVLGAGPYGLSTAAHLRDGGLDVRVFGKPMEFWERNMPVGMLLRSSARASNIADPRGDFALARFAEAEGASLPRTVPLERFVRYAQWFRRELVPDVDERRVDRLERADRGFRLLLADGGEMAAPRVVVAAGIAPFARRPRPFEELPDSLASHSVELRDPTAFRGKRVQVVGVGQSALESAALLYESGAQAEILARSGRIVWIPKHAEDPGLVGRQLRRLLYPPTEVGPRGVNWVAAAPDVFRRLPPGVRTRTDRACMVPMGASWLRPRVEPISLTLGRRTQSAAVVDGQVRFTLDDGETREVDHVLLGTGFRVDVARYDFLAKALLRDLQIEDGYPVLATGLESSIPGLHFVGAPAARTFGPVMRFVTGTAYASPALTRHILGKSPLPLRFSF